MLKSRPTTTTDDEEFYYIPTPKFMKLMDEFFGEGPIALEDIIQRPDPNDEEACRQWAELELMLEESRNG